METLLWVLEETSYSGGQRQDAGERLLGVVGEVETDRMVLTLFRKISSRVCYLAGIYFPNMLPSAYFSSYSDSSATNINIPSTKASMAGMNVQQRHK